MSVKVKLTQQTNYNYINMAIFIILILLFFVGWAIMEHDRVTPTRRTPTPPSEPLSYSVAQQPSSNYNMLSKKYSTQRINGVNQLYVEGEHNTVSLAISGDRPTLSELEVFDAMVENLKSEARTWRTPF